MAGPWWTPTSEADLLLAAQNGTLSESVPHLELKREIGSTDAANKELARDLASLAIDGGLLLVGIVDERHRDPSDAASALNPVDLAQLCERIEQVASTRISPPSFFHCTSIPSAADPTRGYLAVHVPPSVQAPHMVDGRYMGRGDHTKRVLTDNEVVLLHARREQLDRDAAEALDAYVARDPWRERNRSQNCGHLFVVAEPRPGRASMLLTAIGRDDPRPSNARVVVEHAFAGGASLWAPDFVSATNLNTRADGWALTDYSFRSGRHVTDQAEESDLIEIELTEAGAVRVLCGSRGRRTRGRGDPFLSSSWSAASRIGRQASQAESPFAADTSASGHSGSQLPASAVCPHGNWRRITSQGLYSPTRHTSS